MAKAVSLKTHWRILLLRQRDIWSLVYAPVHLFIFLLHQVWLLTGRNCVSGATTWSGQEGNCRTNLLLWSSIFHSADSSQTVCNQSISLFSLSIVIGLLGHCRILLGEIKILSTGQPLESNVAASQSSKRVVYFCLYITSMPLPWSSCLFSAWYWNPTVD